MDFKLVYHSQKDKRWENDGLGFGTGQYDTIGWNGCALTSTAMLLSGYGFLVTPQELNNKLKAVNGFAGSGIKWQAVPSVYSQVKLSGNPYGSPGVSFDQINAALQAGRPVIVRVDTKPSEDPHKPDDHYVLIYSRNGDGDYLMLDPYPSQISGVKPESLMNRYSFERALNQVIERAIYYEVAGYSRHIDTGSVSLPASSTQAGTGSVSTPSQAPAPAPVQKDGVYVRVLASLTSMPVRSSKDTSGNTNVVASVPGGTLLRMLDPQEVKRLGKPGRWVSVHEPNGAEGFAEVQYLEKAPAK